MENLNKGMGGHQSTKMQKDEWLTPPEIITQLGEFDLDPCSPINRPWNTAKVHYTINNNGLLIPWYGRVWLNPPYGKYTKIWLEKMALHNNGIVLIFARTETNMFFDFIWNNAHSIFFIKGRLTFYNVDGTKGKFNGGAPSVLVAFGKNNTEYLEKLKIKGKLVYL